jgi:hypothetical protein
MAAAQEGVLYIVKSNDEAALDSLRSEALDYVSAIDAFAASVWQPHIKEVWQAILNDEAFASSLMIKKGQNQGRLNRYVVTNIVLHLQVLGVYCGDNLFSLHKELEQVDHKNSIYKSIGKYSLTEKQRRRIRELKDTFSTSRK